MISKIDIDTKLFGKRFRQERLRLNLSVVEVADFCNVSSSTVISWEAGRTKISLSAIAALWEHGLAPENIVKGTERMTSLPIFSSDPVTTIPVSEHMLKRYKLYPNSSFVYHNQMDAENLAAIGDLIVIGWLPDDDPDIIAELETTVLMRPRKKDFGEILCKVEPMPNKMVKINIGNLSSSHTTLEFIKQFSLQGKAVFRLEFCKAVEKYSDSHKQRLAKNLKSFNNNICLN